MTSTPQPPPSLPIAPWREQFVETPEVRLHYLEWGDPGQTPLLLLHGIGQTAHTWAYFATAMRRHYRVIAVDQRGHGDSSWAPDGDYSPTAHARDLDAFIERLRLEGFALMGFSMGGRNAMWLVDRYPSKVRRFVIVEAGPERPSLDGSQALRFMSGPDLLGSVEEFIERAIEFNQRRSPAALSRSLLHNLRQLPDGKWTWKYDPVLRGPNRRTYPWGDLWPVLANIACPTLIVRAAESPVLAPEQAARMLEAIPGARMVTISAAGHTVMGDNPVEFEAKVKPFLIDDGSAEK
jgi:pimeloyl-ACP methyl ester carboxylesterase